ncbi:glutaredoxin family protein [Pseudokordiimonas caeni]|uniref:glutaredoxin family protein n=1 Tax=Pseudokordiimonas caeni TaxID=2997908 RepID=UPI00281233B9|nr:glutaredoxin [Pseudokordiimonas caeni]
MFEQDNDQIAKKAVLYRMVMPDHLCPYGLKSRWLLRHHGFEVEDHHLTTREETEAFMRRHNVETTPQTFIRGKRVGGYDELRAMFSDDETRQNGTSYWPVIVIFSTCALMAIAASAAATGLLVSGKTILWFAAFSMCVLGIQKLRDLESFSTMFLQYDLLARRWVPYAFVYPFAEAGAGVLMVAGGVFGTLAAPIALFIGGVGVASVFKAVYLEKRDLKCACVGGDSDVPLGFISLTENLVMVGMGLWMGLSWLV